MDRNLETVIKNIINEIPNSEESFISQLKDNQSSVHFAAPELMNMWWNEVHSTLCSYIPEKPNQEWQFKVLSIFSTRSVGELKQLLT